MLDYIMEIFRMLTYIIKVFLNKIVTRQSNDSFELVMNRDY